MRRRSVNEREEPCAGNSRNCKQLWKVGSNPITRCCFSGSRAHLRFLESSMQQVLTEIEAQMNPYQETVELLMTHPGVQAVAAMGFVSEVRIDLSRFPSAKHAGFLGWCVSRQSYQRRKTQAWENHQGQ